MHWKIQNNVISQLIKNNINIINPWGIETADSSAFFSLEPQVGWRYRVLRQNFAFDNKKYSAQLHVLMREGEWLLDIEDKIVDEKTIKRRAAIKTLRDSFFLDFVMRFRFKKDLFEYAEIADKRLYHNDTNVYNQFDTNHVLLKGYDFDIHIKVNEVQSGNKMKACCYVRDFPGEWIIHLRMIPEVWDKEVIKLCNSWYKTRPLPQWLSNMILKSKSISDTILYGSEKNPNRPWLLRKINPNAYPMVKILKGESLIWDALVTITD